MLDLKYYIKRYLFLLSCALLYCVTTIVYRGRRKAVPPVRNPLLLKSATTLTKEIREKNIKCEDVIQAYIDRILEVEPVINAVVQDNFDEALKEAKKVDLLIDSDTISIKELAKKKPLLGVPFTAKCSYSVKGFPHTCGCLIFKDKIGTEDAPCVAALKKAGGIFLALTNTPEFAGSTDTFNYLYGRTYNPYDTRKSPGGSSGGEAALIASAGSVIGIGTDLYGSNRIPTSYCGIFGCKPTTGWSSLKGLLPVTPPSIDVYVSTGPLCRYSEDLPTLLNVLSINKTIIDLVPKVNFKKLKIYYQTDVKYVFGINTDEEVVQAVRNAALYFKQTYGAEIKEVEIPLLHKSNAIASHVFKKGVSESDLLKCVTNGQIEKINKISESIKMVFGMSQFTLMPFLIIALFYTSLTSNDKDTLLYESIHKELVQEFEDLLDERAVFICPTTPTTAPYHYQCLTHVYSSYWTGVFNLIGIPATQCPMGLSKEKLPIGIQIASCKGNDALSLACATELEKGFGGWIQPR